MTMKLLNPEDFKVIRVFCVEDAFYGVSAYIAYVRPWSGDYSKDKPDSLDIKIEEWLKSLNYKNVRMVAKDNICFDIQMPQYKQIYGGGRPTSKLSLICHGDYTTDEMISMGQVNAFSLELTIYWNTTRKEVALDNGSVFTFDKKEEKFFLTSLSNVVSL